MLSSLEIEVFDRQIRLLGRDVQAKLLQTTALIKGLNRTNKEAVKCLVISGVNVILYDNEKRSSSNIPLIPHENQLETKDQDYVNAINTCCLFNRASLFDHDQLMKKKNVSFCLLSINDKFKYDEYMNETSYIIKTFEADNYLGFFISKYHEIDNSIKTIMKEETAIDNPGSIIDDEDKFSPILGGLIAQEILLILKNNLITRKIILLNKSTGGVTVHGKVVSTSMSSDNNNTILDID